MKTFIISAHAALDERERVLAAALDALRQAMQSMAAAPQPTTIGAEQADADR
jgi:hypothetical protein